MGGVTIAARQRLETQGNAGIPTTAEGTWRHLDGRLLFAGAALVGGGPGVEPASVTRGAVRRREVRRLVVLRDVDLLLGLDGGMTGRVEAMLILGSVVGA